jgi:hypothetical protein
LKSLSAPVDGYLNSETEVENKEKYVHYHVASSSCLRRRHRVPYSVP